MTTPEKSPFNSPRGKNEVPYWLRNGISERAETDRHEADHRRRLGMSFCRECHTSHDPTEVCPLTPTKLVNSAKDRERFDAWVKERDDLMRKLDATETRYQAMWEAWQAAQR